MAGGRGSRISSIDSNVPKPMLRICGKPILEWEIENLKKYSLTDITIVIGHLGDIIKDYFGDGTKFGVNIDYYTEEEPMGTAGALFKLDLKEDFLLLCGDLIMDVDFTRFISFHKENKSLATIMTHPNNHPYDSSIIVTEILPPQVSSGNPIDTHIIKEWLNKEDKRTYYKNRVNSGVEIISPELLRLAEKKVNFIERKKIDLDRDVLKPNIDSMRIMVYDTTEYIKDIGTPDRFYDTEKDIKDGLVKRLNREGKQRALFLDRDGVINKYNGFISRKENFVLIKEVAELIKKANKTGYLVIVVTNQPVIARGECTWEELYEIHNKMETELGELGAYINGIYVCPHHPDKGFLGERIEYKVECNCRKPKNGMLRQAANDFNLDLLQCVMVGDNESDVECGRSVNCANNILIEENNIDLLNKIQL